MENPDICIWYCQCRKSKGDPIAVYPISERGKKVMGTKEIQWCAKLPAFLTKKNVKIDMSFMNAIPIAKRSGATTIMEVKFL